MPDEQQQGTQFRTLQDMETRMRTIQTEIKKIADLPSPTDEDSNWQGTLIAEYDDLDAKATPLRQRMADV